VISRISVSPGMTPQSQKESKMDKAATSSTFNELVDQVRQEIEQRQARLDQHRPALESDLAAVQQQIAGWTMSLGNGALNPAVRQELEEILQVSLARRTTLEQQLLELDARADQTQQIVDPQAVRQRLATLAEVLTADSPTRCNLILSQHIDGIVVQPDGLVELKVCTLGLLGEQAIKLLAETEPVISDPPDGPAKSIKGTRRRRTKLKDSGRWVDSVENDRLGEFACRSERFAGVGAQWFQMATFVVPPKPLSWAEQHAEAVFHRRQEGKLSFGQLAKEFGKSKPTMMAAVQRYLDTHPEACDEVRLSAGGKKPRTDVRPFAQEALRMCEEGMSKEKVAQHFGVSYHVIQRALECAHNENGTVMPTQKSVAQQQQAEAWRLWQEGFELQDIARKIDTSTTTIRKRLRQAAADAGEVLPDLRTRDSKAKLRAQL
jgi:transposase